MMLITACIGLWEFFALQALAGPPLERMAAALTRGSNASHPTVGIPAPNGRLDLRPPSEMLAGDAPNDAFSSIARHKLFDSPAPLKTDFKLTSPTAASDGGHIMSPLQNMAHNFRQQGLPVARLFENKDSLVHLGLNQKGKPGLWILHKLH